MEYKIDKNGTFYAKRANAWKVQSCPKAYRTMFCGDHCPQFGEPCICTGNEPGHGETYINICEDKSLIGSIFDERLNLTQPE